MLKRRNKKAAYAVGGGVPDQSSNILAQGGMMDDSGDVVNGTQVPVGSLREEVADDVPAMLSEGEFVVPADVVRFVGLERLMKMRDKAKEGLERMDEMGQMGNADEVGNPDQQFSQVDDIAFGSEIDSIIGEVDRDGASMQTDRMFAAGGFVTGNDLSKAVQNPAVDVRYYKHDDGRVMYITHINDKPMTSVPDGFKEVSAEDARQVGKKAEESVAAAGGGATGGTGGDGGGGGEGVPGAPGSGSGGIGIGSATLGATGLGLMAIGEKTSKVPTIMGQLFSRGSTAAGKAMADKAIDMTTDSFTAMQTAAAMPGVMSVSNAQGDVTTVSTPQSINTFDQDTFGITGDQMNAGRALNESIMSTPMGVEAANTGMVTTPSGQTVSSTMTTAAQDAATFDAISTGSGIGSASEAAATGMTTTDSGVTVSNDASIAAQDAANFGPDAASGGGGSGSKIICTKLYELGLMDKAVYKADQSYGKHVASKDPALMDGYHYWANIVVDWMSGSGIRVIPFVSDARHNTIMSAWATSWSQEIATPWAEHMQYLMGGRKEDSKIGKALMTIGKPMSRLFANKNTRPTLTTAIGCIATFTTLYVAVKVAKLFVK